MGFSYRLWVVGGGPIYLIFRCYFVVLVISLRYSHGTQHYFNAPNDELIVLPLAASW